MKVSIQASELNLSPEELKQKIPKEKLEALKGKGVLQAYSLAHEGTSHPKVLGEGIQVLKWPKAVIRQLAEKIKTGTKFFIGHKETNAQDNRESVGEILNSFVKEIGGRLVNVIVGHFPNKDKVEDMDICSMEADVYTDTENIVGDVNDISGIALGNSDKESPAFPGALRLSTVQCFDEKGDKTMTLEEIRKAVRDMNIHPWQLFTEDDIKKDREYGKVYTENAALKIEKDKNEKDFKDLKTKSDEAIKKTELSEASAHLDTLMKEGFTDKQKKFIKGRFVPESFDDLSEKTLGEHLEKEKKAFADTAILFGVAEELGDGEKRPKETPEELTMEEEALKEMGVI